MSGAELPGGGGESGTVRVGWLPDGVEEIFGEGARAAESYGLLTVDVPPAAWLSALRTARDGLGCRFFDWLSAVDEPGEGFQVCAHLVALPGAFPSASASPPVSAAEPATASAASDAPGEGRRPRSVRKLLLRTTVPHEAPELPTATGVFAGAAWHERETREMFGVEFAGHPNPEPLLLPEEFEGHPLRKDFVLAARVAKAWPGAVEPGESAHGKGTGGTPKRRQMLPPGVPDPNEWGPQKGRLPSVPSRPARGRAASTGGAASGASPAPGTSPAGGAAGGTSAAGDASGGGRAAGAGRAGGARRAAGERPPRRMRSASAGSASQRGEDTGGAEARQPERPRGRRPSDAPWQRPSPGESTDENGGESRAGTRPADGEDRPSDHEDRPSDRPSDRRDRSADRDREDRRSDWENRRSAREDPSARPEDRPARPEERPSDEGGGD